MNYSDFPELRHSMRPQRLHVPSPPDVDPVQPPSPEIDPAAPPPEYDPDIDTPTSIPRWLRPKAIRRPIRRRKRRDRSACLPLDDCLMTA
jgi:hypothetical protein